MLDYHDFDERNGSMTAETESGLTVTIEQDTFAENPWKAWDGCLPVAVKTFEYRGSDITDDSDLLKLSGIVQKELTKREFKAWLDKLSECEIQSNFHTESLTPYKIVETIAYGAYMPMKDVFRHMSYSEIIDEALGLFDCEDFDLIAELYEFAGIPARSLSAHGYSQGDYVELLFVATPDFFKVTGCKPESFDMETEARQARDLYESWAFGDVYGYVIEDSDGQTLDSCCGFYGKLWENDAYIFDEINSALESIETNAKRKRATRLKELIRNRVPLDKRNQALAG